MRLFNKKPKQTQWQKMDQRFHAAADNFYTARTSLRDLGINTVIGYTHGAIASTGFALRTAWKHKQATALTTTLAIGITAYAHKEDLMQATHNGLHAWCEALDTCTSLHPKNSAAIIDPKAIDTAVLEALQQG